MAGLNYKINDNVLLSIFVFRRRKKCIKAWDDMRVTKSNRIFIFGWSFVPLTVFHSSMCNVLDTRLFLHSVCIQWYYVNISINGHYWSIIFCFAFQHWGLQFTIERLHICWSNSEMAVLWSELQKPYGCCSHSNIPSLRLIETQASRNN